MHVDSNIAPCSRLARCFGARRPGGKRKDRFGVDTHTIKATGRGTSVDCLYFRSFKAPCTKIMPSRCPVPFGFKTCASTIVELFVRFFFTHIYVSASAQAVVKGVVRSSPRYLTSIFIAHRVQQPH